MEGWAPTSCRAAADTSSSPPVAKAPTRAATWTCTPMKSPSPASIAAPQCTPARTGSPSWLYRDCSSRTQRMAAAVSSNTNMAPSPVFFTSRPAKLPTTSARTSLCWRSKADHALSPRRDARPVESSMSVKTKVCCAATRTLCPFAATFRSCGQAFQAESCTTLASPTLA
jgi:hypothetical protein